MTQEEKIYHLQYAVFSELNAREDVFIIDKDFYYICNIDFLYKGYLISVFPNPFSDTSEHYAGDILFTVREIVNSYQGKQITFWNPYESLADVEKYLETGNFPVIRTPSVMPISAVINRDIVIQANNIITKKDKALLEHRNVYLPYGDFNRYQKVVQVVAADVAGYPYVLIDLKQQKMI